MLYRGISLFQTEMASTDGFTWSVYIFQLMSMLLLCVQETIQHSPISDSMSSNTKNRLVSNNTVQGQNGTEFVVMMSPYYNETNFAQLMITSNVQNGSFSLDIQSPFPGSFQTEYTSKNVAVVTLPESIVDLQDGKNQNAIKIRSDHPISVTGILGIGSSSTEAFMATPIDKLGHSYLISTSDRYYKGIQTIGIASIFDNTDVTIHFYSNTSAIVLESSNQTINGGGNYTVSLDYLETFYFETKLRGDLTGTLITSNNPIAVFEGIKQIETKYLYSSRRYETKFRSFGVEQLLATTSYGHEFIIPPLLKATSVDILSTSLKPSNKMYTYSGEDYKVFQNKIANTISLKMPCSLSSRSPLSITVHVKTLYKNGGGYFTVTVPSLSQYSNFYLLTTPYSNITFENFATVIIKSKDIEGLRFDDHTTDAVSRSQINYENQLYEAIVLRLSAIRSHTIHHVLPEVKFGVIVHGLGHDCAYGYSVVYGV